MKKAVACVFALVFWLLLLCTVFSFRIKDWMTPQVTTTTISSDYETFENTLPISCLITDETGQHLYQPADGSAANSITDLREVSAGNYQVFPDRIVMEYSDASRYIQFSTRPLKPDDTVEVLQWANGSEDDVWLAVFPEEVSLVESGSNRLTIDLQAENAVLLSAARVEQPYSESRAKSMLTLKSPDAADEEDSFAAALYAQNLEYHVYSLLDFRQFFAQVPWLSLVLNLILISLALWIASCLLAKQGKKRRRLIALNACVAALLFGIIFLCLQRIDLPSSLLPVQTILDASYYFAEFPMIFKGLESLTANAAAASALSQAQAALWASAGILAAGIVIGVLIVLLENRKRKSKNRPTPRHAARRA